MAEDLPPYHLGFMRSEDVIPGYALRIFKEGDRICVADSPEDAQTILRALNGIDRRPRNDGTAPAGLIPHAWQAAAKAYQDAKSKRLKAAILAYVAAVNSPAPTLTADDFEVTF